ncbi:MAG: hypothetical protein ACYCVD_03620 [Desulfitobacteriaceae bacterium]
MEPFTKHELEVIEAALVLYNERLETGIFAEREKGRIKIILAKLEKFVQEENCD